MNFVQPVQKTAMAVIRTPFAKMIFTATVGFVASKFAENKYDQFVSGHMNNVMKIQK